MSCAPAPVVRDEVITIASVPADHVYVRHLDAPGGADRLRRLADPRPSGVEDPSVWWPPVMLDPEWIRRHHPEFDVFHIHFGFDAQTVPELREIVATLQTFGKPLVLTVHDLRNPHHRDPATHAAHLDVLVPAAAELITLTSGAADVIARRWGRTAAVIPHPHVVELAEIGRERQVRDTFVVGVHLKSLRANTAAAPVIDVVAGAVAELPDAVLRVDVHTDVLDPASRNHDPDLVAGLLAAEQAQRVQLRVHDRFTDDELWSHLRDEIDVSVLPYRFGTHSGWLEACHDLGTMVVAPGCGFYAHQHPCFGYGHDEVTGVDASSLAAAIHDAYTQRPYARATAAGRHAERTAVAAAHRGLYERVLA